jgi:RND family efflux transporter MFP subunit
MTQNANKTKRLLLALLPIFGAIACGTGTYMLVRRANPTAPAAFRPVATAPLSGSPAPAAALPSGYPGVLLPPETIELASRHEGKLASVNVKMGDRVTRDQVVAALDTKLLKQELVAAEASRRAALADASRAGADFANARSRSQRRDAVVKVDGAAIPVVSAEESSAAQFEARSAASRAAGASAAVHERAARLEQLKLTVAEAEFRAPFDGVIAARYFDPGAYIKPGLPVLRVISTMGVRVRFALPEEESSVAAMQAVVDVVLDDGKRMTGRVEQIAPEIEPASRTLFVEASLRTTETSAVERAVLAGRVVRVSFAQKLAAR